MRMYKAGGLRMVAVAAVGVSLAVSAVGCSRLPTCVLLEADVVLSENKRCETVEGVRVELVRFDPEAKTATIRVASSPEVLAAEEGQCFDESQLLRLARVSEHGVLIVAQWCEHR